MTALENSATLVDDGAGALDRLLAAAARRITRFSPADAFAAVASGARIIDIRSQDARRCDGVVPGALAIPLTVLEWRVALESPWRSPHLGGVDECLIVLCDHGYSSVLAAGNLVALGFPRAGDVIGGFDAWQATGLPVARAHGARRRRWAARRRLPGMGPPD